MKHSIYHVYGAKLTILIACESTKYDYNTKNKAFESR